MTRILIVEDEATIRSALKRLLERRDYRVSEAASVEEAERQDLQQFELIISDLRLPGEPGTVLIERAAPVPVLITTRHASMRSAVDTMKQGAVDYIAQPFNDEDLLDSVGQAIEQAQAKIHERGPASAATIDATLPTMIGECGAMHRVYTRIRKTAPADVTVLIQGESGTGKELVARAIHRQSRRVQAPLICVNCAAIPETLIESELFGHEKGAFTGASSARTGLVEAADTGTLFLDEIGELPLDAQARLLRVLQQGEIRRVGSVETRYVDVRLIAATHRDLHAMSKTGEFRLDLYYRLNVMQIELPPLRDREDDILMIADVLLDNACRRHSRQGLKLSRAARRDIRNYPWPGNVRELENALERGVILAEGHLIHSDDLGITMPSSCSAPLPVTRTHGEPSPPDSEELSLEDYFQHFVLEHQEQMSETELAQKLGISRKCLWERRQRLGIPRRRTARPRNG
ncbi:sigma-54-dependent transcriptional regulator [Litchfieldella xinjiangensis]|uniref:sigma-54-dependent transcriptional regulator n=1 Tax=Litchfieldella xinjiangensis TaxID=1166948 RepID=UPI0005BD2779|nr:sigma-54 dependent transcriptional regulator [Halomonas xinjiangensis]